MGQLEVKEKSRMRVGPHWHIVNRESAKTCGLATRHNPRLAVPITSLVTYLLKHRHHSQLILLFSP